MRTMNTRTIDTHEEALAASALYHAEVAHLPRLSRAEQRVLVDRARQGDREARHQLILNCLHWAWLMAHRIYWERRPSHVEILDLAAEANLKMVECLDKALTAHDPVAYLMAIAAQTIRVFCTYHAPLIQRPEWLSREGLAQLSVFLPPVESLDEPGQTSRNMCRLETVAAPPLHLETAAWREQRLSSRFLWLYQAIDGLTASQQATIIRLYGLSGQPRETASEIAHASHLSSRRVMATACAARHHLRRRLGNVFPPMIYVRSGRTKEKRQDFSPEQKKAVWSETFPDDDGLQGFVPEHTAKNESVGE